MRSAVCAAAGRRGDRGAAPRRVARRAVRLQLVRAERAPHRHRGGRRLGPGPQPAPLPRFPRSRVVPVPCLVLPHACLVLPPASLPWPRGILLHKHKHKQTQRAHAQALTTVTSPQRKRTRAHGRTAHHPSATPRGRVSRLVKRWLNVRAGCIPGTTSPARSLSLLREASGTGRPSANYTDRTVNLTDWTVGRLRAPGPGRPAAVPRPSRRRPAAVSPPSHPSTTTRRPGARPAPPAPPPCLLAAVGPRGGGTRGDGPDRGVPRAQQGGGLGALEPDAGAARLPVGIVGQHRQPVGPQNTKPDPGRFLPRAHLNGLRSGESRIPPPPPFPLSSTIRRVRVNGPRPV